MAVIYIKNKLFIEHWMLEVITRITIWANTIWGIYSITQVDKLHLELISVFFKEQQVSKLKTTQWIWTCRPNLEYKEALYSLVAAWTKLSAVFLLQPFRKTQQIAQYGNIWEHRQHRDRFNGLLTTCAINRNFPWWSKNIAELKTFGKK